jgi:integrase
LSWAAAEFRAKPKTYAYYQNSVHRLLEYPPLMVSSINHELRCARRLLRLGVEWGRIEVAPKIRLLSGEVHRERVITPEEEARYLAAAPPLLASVATVLTDTGMRPEECYRLRWEYVTWVNGRHGSLLVTHGKTAAARRVLPMSSRVRAILEERWKQQGQPLDGWVWPAPTRSGHAEPSTVKKRHARAVKQAKLRPFVLYSLRHTFLTRLGASGCDVWTLARIAGHSNISMSMRYVHPSGDAVLAAMGGHEFGHGAKTEEAERLLSA